MEQWQSDLIEAAATLNLEATLYGEGLPGSFVSVPLGDVELVNMDVDEHGDDETAPGEVYSGMELMVRPSDHRSRTTHILQTPVDTFLHPHISIPYFCWGGNQSNVLQWTRNGDWLTLLINCKNLITQYWPGNAYQEWGEHRDGCNCLRKLAGVTGIGDWACDNCYTSCNFCGDSVAGESYYRISSSMFGDRYICENCATDSELSMCPECGDIGSSVQTCTVTGKQFCRSCGVSHRDGTFYHRDAFARVAGSDYDRALISEGSTCLGCRRLVPNEGSRYQSRCQRRNCAADLTTIIAQLMEASSDRQRSSTEAGGDSTSAIASGFTEPDEEALNAAAERAIEEYGSHYSNSERQASLADF